MLSKHAFASYVSAKKSYILSIFVGAITPVASMLTHPLVPRAEALLAQQWGKMDWGIERIKTAENLRLLFILIFY